MPNPGMARQVRIRSNMNDSANVTARPRRSANLGSSLLALCAAILWSAEARAQNDKSNIETVEVTGTIIRGSGPVGSNLITVDRSAIEASGAVTIQNILSEVPGLNNFGGAGQSAGNGVNSSDPAGASSPTIH